MRLTNEALDDIQGIITSGYGHLPQAAYLFVTMTSADGARRWLSRVSGSITTSRRWRRPATPNRPSPSTSASPRKGFERRGLPARVLCTFPLEFQDGIASPERSRILGDTGASAPEGWEIGGPRTDPVHAMLLLFAANETTLDEICRAQRAILESTDGVDELPGSMQRGYRPETETEPFGFHDGIAQPSIAGLDGRWRADRGIHPRIRESLRADSANPGCSARTGSRRHPAASGKSPSRRNGAGRSGTTRLLPRISKASAGRGWLLAVHGARGRSQRKRRCCAHRVACLQVRRTMAVWRTDDAGARR